MFRVLGAAAFVWAATDNFLNQVCHVYMIRYPVQVPSKLQAIDVTVAALAALHGLLTAVLPTLMRQCV